MRFITTIVMVTVSCVMIAPVSLRAGPIIDFEDFPAGTGLVTMISSGGFSFVASEDVFLIVGEGSGASENETQTLFYLGDGLITMFRDDGGVFDLLGVDLGEGNSDRPSSLIFITGLFSPGGSISAIRPLDGILPQFETVTLSGFTNLTSVTFDGDSNIGFSLDNIVVPEPETLVFLSLFALVAIARSLRTRAKIVSGFVIVVLLSSGGTSEVRAQWTGGPVLIGGDDTDHHFTSLGDSYIREGFNFLGTHVTNGNTRAVCIGCNGGLAEASFRQAFDVSQLPAAGWTREILTNSVYILEFFDNTGTVKIQDAGIIYLPSGGELPDNGGITQAQLDVVNTNRIILNDFVKDQDTGGGRYTIAENALAFVPSMRSALTAGSCGGPFEAIFILDVSGSITSEEFSAERDGLLNCLCEADSIPADGTVAVSRGRPAPGEQGALSAVLL